MRKRTSLLAAGALVALGLATTPAHAADPVFTLAGPAGIGLRPHPGQGGEPQKTSVEFRIVNDSDKTFDRQSTFTIDLGALKGIADVTLAKHQGADCKLTAAAVTCKRWALWTGESTVVDLDLTAAKDSKVGATADLTVTGAAEGATFKSATTKVRVGGPDLVLERARLKAEQKPGDKQNLSIVFANEGTDPVDGVVLEMRTSHGIDLVEQYDNCSYSDDTRPGRPWTTGWTTVQCLLEGEYEPGAVYGVDGPLTLKAAPHAFMDGLTYAVYAAGDQPKAAKNRAPASAAKPAGGNKLAAAKQAPKAAARSAQPAADLDPWNNIQEFDFATRNTADLVATGASLTGKAGDTVDVDFGFRNNGPAWVADLRLGDDIARTDVVIPAGARVTKVPAGCKGVNADGGDREQALGAPRYFCSSGHVVGEKETFSYPFQLKIEKAVADAKGSVTVGRATPQGTTGQRWDPNHGNDTAALVINAKGTGPTPSPTPSGTTTASPAPTGSATPTATATPSGSATGTGVTANGGGLASTGSSAQAIALGGAVLLAVGGGLFLAFRRKAGGHA
ncbi:LPXTG cell wall anchor domain-containing protein [Streptomyces sp. NBC_00160]|uniref:LPXTG cell wall anchor domain-containing protein n=1 Tax=Streptomyces sp. NBC_00160 TaxID=2903628 RepID=UPI002258A139|nr:LPXTG cell wall anchor domain-containing protein [Streptomyces sp. NBC_00160]MCX5304225.1 LPXTG cell wall anchor domain-containing protein [Streptomyces sp. NBC_00160]